MAKILITGANSAQAHRLKNQLNTDEVVLGDYRDMPQFMLVSGKMMRLPNPQSTAYTHEMLTLCLDNGIDKVYVLDKQEAVLLLEAVQLFKEYNIDIQSITDEI